MIDYRDLFTNFREQIASNADISTTDITKKIKKFFTDKFHDYFVAPTDKEKEFLVDVFVSTSNPRTLHEGENPAGLKAILVVESELGGEGGGSQSYLRRNVLEDFAKLLVIRAEHKILIFTSLPYANEEDYIAKRVNEINTIYEKSDSTEKILLIHIKSTAQKTARGHPTNPKINLNKEGISGYLISKSEDIQKIS